MPLSMRVRAGVALYQPGLVIQSLIDGYYGCRDEWISDIGVALREDFHSRTEYKRYDMIDLQIKMATLFPTMCVSVRIGVNLLNLTDKEASHIAEEVCQRYAHLNSTGHYMLDMIYDDFLQSNQRVMLFTGNEWSIAAAWWFMLLQRLYQASMGRTVIDILDRSEEEDEDNWYDASDKGEHIMLWSDGVEHEPNPVLWIVAQLGPISTNYRQREEQEHDVLT